MPKENEVRQFSRSLSYSLIINKLKEFYFLTIPTIAGIEEIARSYISSLSEFQKYAVLGTSSYCLGLAIGYRFKSRKENKKLDAIMRKLDSMEQPVKVLNAPDIKV